MLEEGGRGSPRKEAPGDRVLGNETVRRDGCLRGGDPRGGLRPWGTKIPGQGPVGEGAKLVLKNSGVEGSQAEPHRCASGTAEEGASPLSCPIPVTSPGAARPLTPAGSAATAWVQRSLSTRNQASRAAGGRCSLPASAGRTRAAPPPQRAGGRAGGGGASRLRTRTRPHHAPAPRSAAQLFLQGLRSSGVSRGGPRQSAEEEGS